MFENVIAQDGAAALREDLRAAALPPAILLAGPAASGKGTAALELARVLSCCSPDAPWNCACRDCASHRTLSHPDLLVLGSRSFSAEIAAAAAAYLREPESAARLLFLRSLRKLLVRFSPVLWEGEESKLGKIAPLISTLTDGLEDLDALGSLPEASRVESRAKLCDALVHGAFKLEAEGVGDTVPIAQIRRAAFWARHAPVGKRKLLLIEQADRMQDGARNALLKILEEPPETTQLVLCTARRGAMLPTVLSRLRTYHFAGRGAAAEAEVLRRVFRDAGAAERPAAGGGAGLASYLDGFLPVAPAALEAAAGYFAACAAAAGLIALRRRGSGAGDSEALVALGRLGAKRAESGDFGRPVPEGRAAAAAAAKAAGGFEARALFSAFLGRILDCAGGGLRDPSLGPEAELLARSWSAAVRSAEAAVGTYNQNPLLALERLFLDLADASAGACGGGAS